MLKIILNRLKPQAEKIIAEEQAGFRAGRSTTKQIFNQRILCEKYLQHQQVLYHVFIDFKKSFGMQLCGQPFWVVINGPRYLKLVTVSSFLSIYFAVCVDANGVVCHQLGLLGNHLHAVGSEGFVEALN